jgi:hypothetical protein
MEINEVELQKQLEQSENHLEKLKADLYATLGRIAVLKELLSKKSVVSSNETGKEKENAV